MSQGLHTAFNGVPGYVVSDRKCLLCPAASRKTAFSSYLCHGDHKHFQGSNVLLKSFPNYSPKKAPLPCKTSSNSNNHRRNPDFSRQHKRSSRGKSRQFHEREGSENLEETDVLPSKNGPLLSLSSNQSSDQRYQATATPGQREKGIVELFRNVQAQLRARAAIKEEKKIEAAQQGQGERGTVDSLLKLLRKHSIDQRKKGDEEASNLDQPARSNPPEEEQNSNFFVSGSINSEEVHQPDPVIPGRPVSNFRRKSPVPRVKFQPVFSVEEDGSSTSLSQVASVIDEQDPEPEPLEGPDGAFSEEPSDTSDTDETYEETKESSATEIGDLSSLKLLELRGIAKSRGIKGYSKLKKGDLVELLSGIGA